MVLECKNRKLWFDSFLVTLIHSHLAPGKETILSLLNAFTEMSMNYKDNIPCNKNKGIDENDKADSIHTTN